LKESHRQLLDSTEQKSAVCPKKKQKTSAQVQAVNGDMMVMNKKTKEAFKIATSCVHANKDLPPNHPNKKTAAQIVDDINSECSVALSAKTVL